MTTQGRVIALGAGWVDVRIEADKYPGVKDIFNNQSLTGRYIRQDTTSIAEWTTLIGRDCRGLAHIGRELYRTGIFS